MNRKVFLVLALISYLSCQANQERWLLRLDSVIAQRPAFDMQKETKTSRLKAELQKTGTNKQKLLLFEEIFNEYYSYSFNNAIDYAEQGLQLACMLDDTVYQSLFGLYKAKALCRGGLYSEAEKTIVAVDTLLLPDNAKFEYYHTLTALYGQWADYCRGTIYEPEYKGKALRYMKEGIKHLSTDNADYDFFMADYFQATGNRAEAMRYFLSHISKVPENRHTYAMACYSLGYESGQQGDTEQEMDYYIRAAISDQLAINRESTALRKVATLLMERGSDNAERAEHYILIAMDDARFYDTRLRTLETALDYPTVNLTYRRLAHERDQMQKGIMAFAILLALVAIAFCAVGWWQNKRLNDSHRKLAYSNDRLAELNGQLNNLNNRLRYVGNCREKLAKVFIDHSATQIVRHEKFKTLVKRKITINRSSELLSEISSYRQSEEDASVFLSCFDNAFMELYPTFVNEFNALLETGAENRPKAPGKLSTALRIFALIRLGVTNTNEIATLLYLSTQTVYNTRSRIRAQAIDKDSFESNVQQLCPG